VFTENFVSTEPTIKDLELIFPLNKSDKGLEASKFFHGLVTSLCEEHVESEQFFGSKLKKVVKCETCK